jgi:hypothetical protein
VGGRVCRDLRGRDRVSAGRYGREDREMAGSDLPPRGKDVKREVLRQEDLSARTGDKVKPLPPEKPKGYKGRHEGRG